MLALDTATESVVAGLVELPVGGGRPAVLAERAAGVGRRPAESLMPLVGEVAGVAGRSLSDVDVVVCGAGPGPFTGLRVGMVTAAALADALAVAVHPVCSLDAVALESLALLDPRDAAVRDGAAPLLVVADARRKELYWAVYDADGAPLVPPSVARPDVVVAAATGLGAAAVAGTTRHAEVLDAAGWPRVGVPGPTAAGLTAVAAAALRSGTPPGPLTPLYLRRPDAREPGPKVRIAPLRRDELRRCAELEQQLFPADSPWREQAFRAELAMPDHHYLAARSPEGRLVGYAGLAVLAGASDGRHAGAGAAEAEVHTIGVDPAWQHRGIGRALLRGLLVIADDRDATVFLDVRTDNAPAITLYGSEGFTVVGTRRRYYQPSGADAYTMRRPPSGDRARGAHRADPPRADGQRADGQRADGYRADGARSRR